MKCFCGIIKHPVAIIMVATISSSYVLSTFSPYGFTEVNIPERQSMHPKYWICTGRGRQLMDSRRSTYRKGYAPQILDLYWLRTSTRVTISAVLSNNCGDWGWSMLVALVSIFNSSIIAVESWPLSTLTSMVMRLRWIISYKLHSELCWSGFQKINLKENSL